MWTWDAAYGNGWQITNYEKDGIERTVESETRLIGYLIDGDKLIDILDDFHERLRLITSVTMRYDALREFNVDWKAECGRSNLYYT